MRERDDNVLGLVKMKFFKQRKKLFIISLVGFCLLLIILSNAIEAGPTIFGRAFVAVTAPVQRGFSAVGTGVSNFFGRFRSMADLREENQRLITENSYLVIANDRLRFYQSQLDYYAAAMGTQVRFSNFGTMFAMVSANEPGNWYTRFIIDRGANHGLSVNMPVLSVDGALLGRISEVWDRAARIEAIIDDRSGVSAVIFRSDAEGFVRGDVGLRMSGLVSMEFFSLGVDIQVGDEVRTSQLSTIYPSGILIGFVESIDVDPRGHTRATIRPAANFSPIRFVVVIAELFEDFGLYE